MARIFQLKPRTLYSWYRDVISSFHSDTTKGRFAAHRVYDVDADTGEINKEQVVHIVEPKQIGANMCLDEKMVSKKYTTILSNQETGKIALLIDSVNPVLVKKAISCLGQEQLEGIKNISADMSPVMKKIIRESIPQATIVIDKFHVIKHILDALNAIRLGLKQEAKQSLEASAANPNGWTDLQLLEKTRYLLFKLETELDSEQKQVLHFVLGKYPRLYTAYYLVQEIRTWYNPKNIGQPVTAIDNELHRWLQKVKETKIKAFQPIVKMFNTHYQDIIRYFEKGLTNAKAENLNGHIQRLITTNFGTRDRNFFFYRLKIYYSST